MILADREIKAALARGGHLFAKLACASCHMANGDTPAHIPLTHVQAKWKPAALVSSRATTKRRLKNDRFMRGDATINPFVMQHKTMHRRETGLVFIGESCF